MSELRRTMCQASSSREARLGRPWCKRLSKLPSESEFSAPRLVSCRDQRQRTDPRSARDKIARNVNADEAAVLGMSSPCTPSDPNNPLCHPPLPLSRPWRLVLLLPTPAGAALYGASLSRHFRTKEIKVQDIATYDIAVAYNAEAKLGPGEHILA